MSNTSLCFECEASYFYLDGECLDSCPSLYFEDSPNCTLCDISCTVCTGTPTPCSECATGYFLYGGACLGECIGGEFFN